MNETTLVRLLMLSASKLGLRLFRNNVGALQDKKGSWIKYGVCNPGGSDLIGWSEVQVTPQMVGKTVCIFTAVEAKSETGRLSQHQKAFLDAVKAAGGVAIIARSVEDLEQALGELEKWVPGRLISSG